MSSTFATRLVGAEGRHLRKFVLVQGVQHVFQEDATDVPDAVVNVAGYGTGADRARFKGVQKIEQAAKQLDMVKRRMVGGSLTVTLQDDTSGTLAALFAPRTRRAAFMAGDVDDNDIDIPTSSVTPFSSGDIFIGGETITYNGTDTGVDPDVINSTARGAYGSEAQAHFGDTEQGASIFLVPPSWVGRRMKLVGYFVNDDGTTTTSLTSVLDTFRLEEAPIYLGDGRWQLRGSHLSDEYAAKKLGTGLRDVEVNSDLDSRSGEDGTLVWPAYSSILLTQGSRPTQLLLNAGGDEPAVYDIISVVTEVATPFESRVTPWHIPRRPETQRHIAILEGDTVGTLALVALASIVGDATNGSFDQLGGFKRTTFGGLEFRLGAGIAEADIDTAAFLDVGAATGWQPVIDDEQSVADFLADFCLVTESFWYVTPDGQISVRRVNGDTEASAGTIDDDGIIGEPQVSYDEDRLFPRVSLKCNYDPVSGGYEGSFTLGDTELADRYPTRDDALELESKFIVVRPQATGGGTLQRETRSIDDIETLLRGLQLADGRGRCIVALKAHLDVLAFSLGDMVTLTVAVPNLEGSEVSQRARVLSVGPDYDGGFVDMTLELAEQVRVIAPAAVIASIAGSTLTLATTGPEVPTNPGRMFAGTWIVRVYDVSANTSEDIDVASVGNSTIVLGAAPAFVIEDNVDFVSVSPQSANNGVAATNQAGLAITDFTYQMPDDENSIGADEFETRWR